MIRHPKNTNLTLYYENTYLGLAVQVDKAPFIQEYLSRLHQTISRSLSQYSRVFAFRFDLRLPTNIQLPDYAFTNEVVDRFIESFKAKIKHNRQMAKLVNKYAH